MSNASNIGYRLDGEIVDFHDFIANNAEDPEACEAIRALELGESVTLGGGAAASFVLSRDARDVTRFDLHPVVREAMTWAVQAGMFDGAEAFCLGARHGCDARALMAELVTIAFADRHCPVGQENHRVACSFNNRLYLALGGK